jgi:hypothetical protein
VEVASDDSCLPGMKMWPTAVSCGVVCCGERGAAGAVSPTKSLRCGNRVVLNFRA